MALCPDCLLRAGSGTVSGDTATGPGASFATPKPEEIAPHFPKFEVLGILGRGGMGVVYQVRQKSLNRLAALKLLAPERVADATFAERFQREAQALAALSHPHIVTVFDFGQAGGFYYLLMEFVDGVNLRQAMQAGRFTPEQALAVVPPVCEALQFAHEHGIMHRDIKPENLLLDKDGRVKIADFGIAKILGTDAADIDFAESQPAGTPQYMAPEQKGHARTDHRADIYSLGVVLYELLTGELPADKLQPPSSRLRGVQIDVRLDEIVLRALEKTPELRFQTAAEMRTQVETVTQQAAKTLTSGATHSPAEPTRFSRTAIWGAAWVTLFFAVIPPFLWHESTTHEFEQSGPFGSALGTFVFFVFIFPAFIAPFGATILGWIAVTQIRRAAGGLHGQWLAVFSGLCFPLLTLDTAISLLIYGFGRGFLGWSEFADSARTNRILFLTFVLSAILDYLLIQRIWRAVNDGPRPAPDTQTPPATPSAQHNAQSVIAFGIACLSSIFGTVANPMRGEPPQPLIWANLISALLGIALAIPVRRRSPAKWAIWIGGIETIAWLIFALVGTVRSSAADREGFAPPVECVVADAMDLETGALLPLPIPPPWSENDPQRYAWFNAETGEDSAIPWLRRNGIDIIDLGNHGLAGIDVMLTPLEPRQWSTISPTELDHQLRAHFPDKSLVPSSSHFGDARGTYGFKTRDGTLGLIQCLDSNLPRGVQIRYKLSRAGSSGQSGSGPAAALRLWPLMKQADQQLWHLIEKKDAAGAIAWMDGAMKPQADAFLKDLQGTALEQRTRLLVERSVPLRRALESEDWSAVNSLFSGNPDRTFESDLEKFNTDSASTAPRKP